MVNRTYADFARHYGTALLPARPYRPKDKAKAEVGVQIVGRWVLARLRNHHFYSLGALNRDIWALLADLNQRPLRGWNRSGRELFDTLDRPALSPCPMSLTNMPSGSAAGWVWITMSKSPSITTRYPPTFCARRSMPGSRPKLSRSSGVANGSPRTCVRWCPIAPDHCRARAKLASTLSRLDR